MVATSNQLPTLVFGFIGVLVGAFVGLLGVRLQISSTKNERHQERQYEWLIALQDALYEFVKEVVVTHLANVKNFEENPNVQFGATPIPDEDFQREAALSRKVEIYNSRIDDGNIRKHVTELLTVKLGVARPRELRNAWVVLDRLFELNNIAIQLVGATIRSVDRDGLPDSSSKGN